MAEHLTFYGSVRDQALRGYRDAKAILPYTYERDYPGTVTERLDSKARKAARYGMPDVARRWQEMAASVAEIATRWKSGNQVISTPADDWRTLPGGGHMRREHLITSDYLQTTKGE